MITRAADGWFIEHNHRYYHVNQKWLDEMYRHQVKPYGNNPEFNQLQHAFNEDADADEISERFKAFMGKRGSYKKPRERGGPPSEFQEFIKTQRGRRANR